MTDAPTPPTPRRTIDWDLEGIRLGETLVRQCAIVVIGANPEATARVALGIGRAQSVHRRVVIGDLIGDAPPLRALVPGDEPYGLVDSFEYGVSLNRIAVPVAGSEGLSIMPTGTEAPDFAGLFTHPRWRRLVDEFRETGALLVLAAPAGAPHIEDLVAATDGTVLIGESVMPQLPAAFVIGVVREVREPRPSVAAPAEAKRRPRRKTPWPQIALGAGLVTVVLIAMVGLLLFRRRRAELARQRTPVVEIRDTAAARAAAAFRDSAARADSAARDSASTIPVVANPGDAARAALFSVELMSANTQSGAILKLQKDGKYLPAGTFTPVTVDGARWFKVYAGAYTQQRSAESLLLSLGRRRLLGDGSAVVRVPYAYRIDIVDSAAVPAVIAAYVERGQPVYALRQEDGSVWLYQGAFESPAQAEPYAQSLRAAGIKPILVYRKGRVF